MKMFPENQRILVLGLGISGYAAAELSALEGGQVTVLDAGSSPKLRERMESLQCRGVEVILEWNQAVWDRPVDLCIVSPGIPEDSKLGRLIASLTCPVISELEYGFMRASCPILAITGTNGKTTTTELLTACLKQAGLKVMAAGNIGIPLCEAARKSAILDFLVVEVSSFQLEKCHKFAPFAAAILNITPDHFDRYPDMHDYRMAKARLMHNMKQSELIVLRDDVVDMTEIRAALPADGRQPVIFSGTDNPRADYFLRQDGMICRRRQNGVVELISRDKIRLRGSHNLENMMVCTALCHLAGVPFPAIKNALETFSPSSHRLELVGLHHGIRFINDSKSTNPDSLCRALMAVAEENPGKILLIAGGLDKGLEFSSVMPFLQKYVKEVFLIGKSREQLANQWNDIVYCKQFASLAAAVDAAVESALPGDTVLLSPGCASMDMFENYAERGRLFCELVKRRFGE